jgi:DNA-binding NarL/FixJ family response regulator
VNLPHPEQLHYNEEAFSILSNCTQTQGNQDNISHYVSLLCLKWLETLENHSNQAVSDSDANDSPGMRHIAMLESKKRKYVVKATTLMQLSGSKKKKQYLFVIERLAKESANLPLIFQKYKLNAREQEIVRLLLAGDSNKEIASRLDLSENTIKGYMKLLMRKLGVNNRVGIIGALLVEK